MTKKVLKKVPKRPPSPAKTEVLYEKNCLFLLKKTSQPRKKLKFCMKKWQKNDKKRYQKEHPAPQNLIFCMKKKFFFYSKRPPTLAKNWIFAWKNDKKLTKNWPKNPSSNAQKSEVLNENLKIVLPMGILKKKISTPNFTKFLNP